MPKVRPRVPPGSRRGRRRGHTQTGVATTQTPKAWVWLAIPGLEVGVTADADVHLRARHHRLDAGLGVRTCCGVLSLCLAKLYTVGGGGGGSSAACGHRSWRQQGLGRQQAPYCPPIRRHLPIGAYAASWPPGPGRARPAVRPRSLRDCHALRWSTGKRAQRHGELAVGRGRLAFGTTARWWWWWWWRWR